MRSTRLLLAAAAAAASFGLSSPADASVYCSDLGPVPGYGPVCTVKCVLGAVSSADPDIKDLKGTLTDLLVIVCPA